MNLELKYDRLGKLIYGAHRHGGDIVDVYNWMADELQRLHLSDGDDDAHVRLQADYFAKYVSDEQFSDSYQRFMIMMEARRG
jgi:hypothetical protein